MRVYLDTAILIYLVEDVPPFCAAASARLAAPEIEKVTSELARMEALVLPLRNGNAKLAAAFHSYIDTACMEALELSRGVMETAAALRARNGFLRTPDAIHLAAAIAGKCDILLTNDHRLDRFVEFPVEVLTP
jgi:predicted nucleic acid-binding protein